MLTSYGVKRSFACWPEEEKREYLQKSLEVIRIIDDFTPNAFYAYGTLLGFVRERDYFIPHDSDIDIMVLFYTSDFPTLEDVYNAFVPFLKSKGVVFESASQTSYHVKYKGSKRFDIFPGLIDTKGYVFVSPLRRGKWLHESFLLPTMTMKVMGLDCPIPNNPFEYFRYAYGDDWKIPADRNYNFVDSPIRLTR